MWNKRFEHGLPSQEANWCHTKWVTDALFVWFVQFIYKDMPIDRTAVNMSDVFIKKTGVFANE